MHIRREKVAKDAIQDILLVFCKTPAPGTYDAVPIEKYRKAAPKIRIHTRASELRGWMTPAPGEYNPEYPQEAKEIMLRKKLHFNIEKDNPGEKQTDVQSSYIKQSQ